MLRLRHAVFVFTVTFCVMTAPAPAPARARAAEVRPPVAATVPLRAGQPVKGQIVAFDAESVRVLAGDTSLDIQWSDVKPQAVLALHERLLGSKATAEQWMQAGVTLLKVPGGRPLAERPFARALRLDPKLKAAIEAAKRDADKPSGGGGDGGSADARRVGREAGEGQDAREVRDAPDEAQDVPAGVTWGRQSDAEREKTVAALKEQSSGMLGKAGGMKLSLYETKYFLFYTDLTGTEATRWVAVLDRMYARLAEMFGVPRDENIWHGKAVIFVFAQRDDFRKFEKAVFNIDKDAGGRCHQRSDGTVVITFFRSDPPEGFARVLVHESTHGFLFRYRSPRRIPSWANEGLAEVMEFELVPAPGIRQSSDAQAKVELRKPDAMKDFFDGGQITFPQYPVARTLSEFMIRQNKRGYVDFINGIKDGLSWRESLEQKYGVPVEKLVAAYGASMGVPGLKP